MNTQEALDTLGVTNRTLSDSQKKQLDDEGYLIFENVFSPEQLNQVSVRLDQLYKEEVNAGSELTHENGCERLANLYNKGVIFEKCCTYPPLLAAVSHILKSEFHTNSLNFRNPKPGYGIQRMHPDITPEQWSRHKQTSKPGEFARVNSLWLIDPFTGENGSTRIVPRSHLWDEHPSNTMPNHYNQHPDETILVLPAGTVVAFNAHLWHGGTTNISGASRRALHSSFVRRDYEQQLIENTHILPETYQRVSPAVRFLLNIN